MSNCNWIAKPTLSVQPRVDQSNKSCVPTSPKGCIKEPPPSSVKDDICNKNWTCLTNVVTEWWQESEGYSHQHHNPKGSLVPRKFKAIIFLRHLQIYCAHLYCAVVPLKFEHQLSNIFRIWMYGPVQGLMTGTEM